MSASYHTALLPPLAKLAAAASQMEPEHTSRRPVLPSLATSSYNQPPPPSPYAATSQHYGAPHNPTSVPSVAFLTSAGDSRRPYMDEKATSASSRLLLPSIHEALAHAPSQNPPPSASSSHQSYIHPSPRSPQTQWKSLSTDMSEYSHMQPSSHDTKPARAPYMGSIAPATPRASTAYIPRDYTPQVERTEYPFRMSTSQSYAAPQTPRHPSPPPPPGQHWSGQIPGSQESYSRPSEQQTTGYNYPSQPRESFAAPAPPPPQAASSMQSYPFAPHHPSASASEPTWRQAPADVRQVDHLKTERYPYSDSVKMHLDYFDLESAWHDIAGSSHQVFEIAQHYEQRAHQTQKSGPLPGSTATIAELDTIIRNAGIMSESALRMREIAVSHEAALAERAREQGLNNGLKHTLAEDAQDGSRESGYGGSDPKKPRRGRAAPPGRCHSCNRAETPEWRRGPDGARTLCNACGLHYAKLTRKQGAQKQPLGSSNLRPTSLDSTSPAS